MPRVLCWINTRVNITSMGESIFFLVSKPASRIAGGDDVIRAVNEALSHWLTLTHDAVTSVVRRAYRAKSSGPLQQGEEAETGKKTRFIYAGSEMTWFIMKYTQAHQLL